MRFFTSGSLFVAGALVASLASPGAAGSVPLDPAYSGNGKTYVSSAKSSVDSLVQDGSNVYAAGSQRINGHWRLFVSRLDSHGQLDSSFAGDGRRIVTTGNRKFLKTGLAVGSNGRPVLVSQSKERVLVVRLTRKGGLDKSFSKDGRTALDTGLTGAVLRPRGRRR